VSKSKAQLNQCNLSAQVARWLLSKFTTFLCELWSPVCVLYQSDIAICKLNVSDLTVCVLNASDVT